MNGLRTQAKNGRHAPQEFVALDHVLHDMRLYKSRRELELMRTAAQIAARAHQRAMRICRPGLSEYQLMAELLHEFRRHNADTAYQPIVGGGANSCILHYRENDQPLASGDLLLIDAGCEYDYYASDITRTFPVNGRFTPAQRAVYEVVLEANRAAIAKVRPGNHWNEPHEAAVRVITAGLVKLGLLKGRVPSLIKSGAYRRYFMHRTGHWLGLDVHDVGDYKIGDEWRVLEPGMTLTVEPGIYLAGQCPRRAQALPQHRHPHRGRRGGHQERRGGAELARAEGPGPDRSADGARLRGRRVSDLPAVVDVAIVGGGMVGASLAAALSGTGVRVLLIESVALADPSQPSFDERTTALGNASRRIFEALGAVARASSPRPASSAHPRLGCRALRLCAARGRRAGRCRLRLRQSRTA